MSGSTDTEIKRWAAKIKAAWDKVPEHIKQEAREWEAEEEAAESAGSLLPVASDLDVLGDPASRIILSCERAKTWLQQALDGDQIEQIVELKSQAEAIRVYTVQKQLGHDAELSAAEIVRRAERCIGLAIRKGQEEGRLYASGGGDKRSDRVRKPDTVPTRSFFSNSQEMTESYSLTDGVSNEQFEDALSKAKAEKNLSRANVVRKVRGEEGPGDRWAKLAELAAEGNTSHQIAQKLGVRRTQVKRQADARGVVIHADLVVGRSRLMDPERVLREFVGTLESLAPSCELIDPAAVKPDVLLECVEMMADAMKALRKLERRLRGALDG